MKNLTFILLLILTSLSTCFGQVKVSDSLIGYWSFDDTTATDNSGRGHNGVFQDSSIAINAITGPKKAAMHFNGTSQWIDIANKSDLNEGEFNPWSLSVWFRTDSNDNSDIRPLVSKRVNASTNSDYVLFKSNGTFYWGTGDASDINGAWMHITEPSKGVWHHIVTTISYNSTTSLYYKQIFLDGVLVKSGTATIKGSTTSKDLRIGGMYDANVADQYWNGDIDEVRIYNRELSDCDVQALYKFGNVLQGTASTSTGAALANSKISLIVYNPADTTLTEVSSTYSDSKGNYCLTAFDSVVYIYAAPDSANYPHEMPAYGDSFIDFSGATPTHISNGHNTANVKTLSGSNPGGSGFIGGKIVYCTICKKAGSGTPAQGLKVILADSMGHPQAITYTDAKGNFSFQNIALTKYTILVDRPNVDNANAPKVQLTADLTLRANLNFTLYPTYLALDVTSGIEENNAFSKSIEIFPNPANQYINIHNGAGQKIESIHIFNMLGETVRLNNVNSSSENIQINLNDLKSGIYLLEVRSESQNIKRQQLMVR